MLRALQIKAKYATDRAIACILLIVLMPLFLIIALLIKIDSPGPIIFKQERVGYKKKLFTIYKFRTMIHNVRHNSESDFNVYEGDTRITNIGKILRKWSLDEIPQFFNIVKGDMSFIGPRPTLLYQVEKYTDEQIRRLNMKPGITGYAQVHGRNSINWDERIRLDIYYIENYSIWLDFIITLKTIWLLAFPQGIYTKNYSDNTLSSEQKD
jgi:lipopolysaccharide/colanic/teichoic acid biosynthesis glycosyltransferase